MRSLLILGLALFVISACDKRETENFDTNVEEQYGYFPLQSGAWIEYQVDSIVYDYGQNNQIVQDSTTTFVREEIQESFIDLEGKTAYKIQRYERTSEQNDWESKAIWVAQRTENQAIRTEDNQRFLRLVFPFDKRSEWDGLVYMNAEQSVQIAGELIAPYSNWEFEVDSLDLAGMIGSFNFDSLLYITEADDNNIIERRYVRSIYAKNVGLVEREEWILDSQYCNQEPVPTDCETRPWELKAETGYILRQTVIDYGQ